MSSKRILLFCSCALMLGVLLCGCTHESSSGTPSSEAPLPDNTETDPPLPAGTETEPASLPPLSPAEIAATLSNKAVPLQISPVCRQVTLSRQNLTAVQKAFTERGYTVVPSLEAAGTKLKTAVLRNDSQIVTLTETSSGSVHILWESAKKVSTVPLSKPEETQDGDVTMVQIGIARESEKDNPMIGLCCLYRLADGSAVILDGGCNNGKCADNLCRSLKKLNISKTEDGKYRISAWIFSHGHGDHIGTFKKFTEKYAGQYKIDALMYSFPSKNIGLSGCDAEAFEITVKKACPDALRISPHAGLRYHFGDLTVHVLYHPELLYTENGGIGYFNNTSLILKIEANGRSVLHLGDAGEQASQAAWKANDVSAFVSDILQITHHGLYTGPESHDWNYLKKIYDASSAPLGILPMGTRYPGDARDGRHTVLIVWGVGLKFQVSYALDISDSHGISDLSQSDFERFAADAENGTAEYDTLYGFDGINIAKNRRGMVTYLSASENDLMATEFTLNGTGVTVAANGRLSDWLAD